MITLARTRFFKRIAVVLFSAFLASVIHAGSIYNISHIPYKNGVKGSEISTETKVEGSNLKMQIPDDSGEDRSEIIYRGEEKKMIIVDHQRRTYMEVDEQFFAQISAQLNQAMAQMEAALANVPPAQRQMMEEMMKKNMPQGMAGPASMPKVEVKEVGDGERINGVDTTHYEVYEDGARVAEHWVASWASLDGSLEMATAFMEMSSFFSDMIKSTANSPMGAAMAKNVSANWFGQLDEMDGLPVRTKSYDRYGALEGVSNFKSSEEKDIDPAEFLPPPGYRKQQMGGPPQQRGQRPY